jgi:hypothetical protein
MIGGSIVCTGLLYLAAGLGHINTKSLTQAGSNTILACFIMLPAFTRISASNNAFLTGAEIGGVRMRKKTMVSSKNPRSDDLLTMCTGFWNRMRRRCCVFGHIRDAVSPTPHGCQHWLDLRFGGGLLCRVVILLLPRTEGKKDIRL